MASPSIDTYTIRASPRAWSITAPATYARQPYSHLSQMECPFKLYSQQSKYVVNDLP